MATYDANVVIHVDEKLTDEQIHEIERQLSNVQGVVSACVHIRTPHLLVIDYDPRTTYSGQLLQEVKNNSLSAQLIGGV